MGICQSSCAHSDFEYYDAWGHKPARSLYSTRSHLAAASGDTKLWMCARGCCSIQWKLDYAEFQAYRKYAAVSPYVVVQDKTRACRCVICCGLADAPPQDNSCSLTDACSTDDEDGAT